MKNPRTCSLVALLILLGSILANARVDLKYFLEYKLNRIHVTLKYIPLFRDSTIFTYGEPQFGGQNDIIQCISNVRTAVHSSLTIDPATRSFTLYYSTLKPIVIEYDILDTTTARKDVRKELFRPIIQKNYFYCHGVNLFLNPQIKEKGKKITVSIQWIQKPSFPLFYGFDPENKGKKKACSTVDSTLFSLMTGASDLSVDKFSLNGTQNYIVLRGESNKLYNRPSIRDYFVRVNTSIRKFWNDYTDPCFSLILQPFLEADHSISGVAFANGFIGKYKADTILNTQRIFVISHEIGHHWLGHRLEMNISHQWFGEGFNDYITFYTLVSGGLITLEDFEDKMNEVFKSHYTSDICNTPNDSVFKNYWKMGDYNRLPYRRGAIFAFYLDNQIRLASNGEKSIRDFLRALALFRREKPSDYEITVDDFIEQAAIFLPRAQVMSDLDEYILKGNPIPFDHSMLTPQYQLMNDHETPQIKIVDEKKFKVMYN